MAIIILKNISLFCITIKKVCASVHVHTIDEPKKSHYERSGIVLQYAYDRRRKWMETLQGVVESMCCAKLQDLVGRELWLDAGSSTFLLSL